MSIEAKKIFITGGAGFIGTALISRLIENNEIVVYDNLHRNSIKNSPWINHPNLTIVKGDVLDLNKVKEAVKDSEYIIHLAAIAGIDTVTRDLINTMKVNMMGTFNVLEAALGLKSCRRFIDFSTSEVYGRHAKNVKESDDTTVGAVGEGRWIYAASKLAAEHLAHSYHEKYALPVISIRPFNIYGPGQVGEGAVKKFVSKALVNEEIEIRGSGKQVRSWCYIDDLADAILLCMENDNAIGHVFNIGNPEATATICDLGKLVIKLLDSRSPVRFISANSADVELRIPDISKAQRLLGFRPGVKLEKGIRNTADWYKKINKG